MRYIPYMVAVKADGSVVKTFDAAALMSAYRSGNFAETLIASVE